MSEVHAGPASEFGPEDDYTHQPTDDPTFNESAFFHVVDWKDETAILVRIGNRVNEGHAEVTVLALLPDGEVGFQFARVPIDDNSAFDAAGLRFEVVDPLMVNRVTYDGDVRMMTSGSELEDPKTVFASNPVERLEFTVEYEGLVPPYAMGQSFSSDAAHDSIGTSHYRQPCRTSGTVTLRGRTQRVESFAFRDHSWGPRKWTRPNWWRYYTGIVDQDNWFEAFAWKIDGERQADFAAFCRDGVVTVADRVDFTTIFGPAPHYPESTSATIHTQDGPVVISGDIVHGAPLRHRKDGETARIMEMIVRSDFFGMTTHGFAEYHDGIVDGVPVGRGEA